MPQSIKPTQTELRNSWDETSLNAYVAERNQAAATRIFGDPNEKGRKRPMKVENVRGFSPHRWGK